MIKVSQIAGQTVLAIMLQLMNACEPGLQCTQVSVLKRHDDVCTTCVFWEGAAAKEGGEG